MKKAVVFVAVLLSLITLFSGCSGNIAPNANAGVDDSGDDTETQKPISLYDEYALNLKTAYSDNAQGSAVMCEILKDYAETTPADADNSKSSPLCTPLLRGTFDYIVSEAEYDNKLHYILSSGVKVCAGDTKKIEQGFKLPSNAISGTIAKNDDGIVFTLDTDWIVPVQTSFAPQEYYTGYQSRVFNAEKFTAEYIDFVFSYTSSAEGGLSVPKNSIAESAEWLSTGENDTATLRLNLKNAGRFYGYSLKINSGGKYEITIKNHSTSIKNKVIMLDPGHGGKDPGASCVIDSINEKDLNYTLAEKVKAYLENMGATVIMTRTADTFLSLDSRVTAVRNTAPDLFISIHCDSSENAGDCGTHTFYYTAASMPLAQSIYNRMIKVYQNKIYKEGSAEYDKCALGIKFYPFMVTRVEECPSVLVECGYLSNKSNAEALLKDEIEEKIAKAIANGVKDFFS